MEPDQIKRLTRGFSAAGILTWLCLAGAAFAAESEQGEFGKLEARIGELYAAGRYAEAIPLATQLLEQRAELLGPEHPDVALSLHNLASLYYTTGDYRRAEPRYERSLAIWEKALGPEHPNVALSLNNLAELYRATGDYARAKPLYERALAIVEKALGPEHPAVATALGSLASLSQSRISKE